MDTNIIKITCSHCKEQIDITEIVEKVIEIKNLTLSRKHNSKQLEKCLQELNKNNKAIERVKISVAGNKGNKKNEKLKNKLERVKKQIAEIDDLIKETKMSDTSVIEGDEMREETINFYIAKRENLQNEIKCLEYELQHNEYEQENNLRCLSSMNDCLSREVEFLEINIKETDEKIEKLSKELVV